VSHTYFSNECILSLSSGTCLSHQLGGRRPDGYAWAASPFRASARQLSGDCRFAVPLVAAAAACSAVLGDAAEALVAHQQRSGYQNSHQATGAKAGAKAGAKSRRTVGLLTLLLRVCWHRSIGLSTALAALNALAPLKSVRDRLLTMRVGPGRPRAYEAYFNANDDEDDDADGGDWSDSSLSKSKSTGQSENCDSDGDDDDDDDDGGDDFVPFLAHRLLLECAQVSPMIAAYSLRLTRSLVRHDLRYLRYAANLLLHVPRAEGEQAQSTRSHTTAHAKAKANADASANADADADADADAAPVAAAHIYIEDVVLNLLEAVLSAHALASGIV
jgi:hypothetical protein